MNPFKSNSQQKENDLEREIVECIEEEQNLHTDFLKQNKKIEFRQKPKSKTFRNMQIITEIEDEVDQWDKILRNLPINSLSTQNSYTNFPFSSSIYSTHIPWNSIYLKNNKSSLHCKIFQKVRKMPKREHQREFRCYMNDDVIKHKGIKPINLTYNLTKGDDDEDSELEDVQNGKWYLKRHLDNALMELMK